MKFHEACIDKWRGAGGKDCPTCRHPFQGLDDALLLAALHGRTDTVAALLKAGANIEAQNGDEYTALLLAASSGHTGTVRALLDAGANIEAQNEDGDTALIRAAWNGYTATVRALRNAGAKEQ